MVGTESSSSSSLRTSAESHEESSSRSLMIWRHVGTTLAAKSGCDLHKAGAVSAIETRSLWEGRRASQRSPGNSG